MHNLTQPYTTLHNCTQLFKYKNLTQVYNRPHNLSKRHETFQQHTQAYTTLQNYTKTFYKTIHKV